ncbi:Uma2 family endonuclease [Thermoleptolyngbya sp.]
MVPSFQPAVNAEEQRVLLSGVTWQQYENLLATLDDYPGLRLIYLEGALEIFRPSAEHELIQKGLARLIERYAEAVELPLHGYGSTTFRQEATARGLEPDECYCIDTLKPLPDFAIEVSLSSGGVDKLAVYQGLGVPEVLIWQAGDLTLYDLRGAEQNRGYPRLKPTARYREQRSKAGQDSGQMSGFDARESAN